MVHLGGPYRQYKGKQRDPGCGVHSPALIHSHGHPQAHALSPTVTPGATVVHTVPLCRLEQSAPYFHPLGN